MTTTSAPTFDRTRADAFAERMLGTLNAGALALMISIGHRARLFDVLAESPPCTSDELAARAGLQERYVREWLAAMTVARIVEYDPATTRHHLPPEHAAYLTRKATPDNLAVAAQWIAVLGGVEDRVVECFRRGGGVPYAAFARFHEVMEEESAQTVAAVLVDRVLPLVPGLAERLERGIDVLDVGCGRGRALRTLAARFPLSAFVGRDLSTEAVAAASETARRAGLRNVRFEVADAAAMTDENAFDLVTAFDAIHDQRDPAAVLRAIERLLRPDGVFLMQDIRAASAVEAKLDHPLAPFLYTISTMHCMTVSLAAGGAGLGTCWGRERAREMLAAAGFGAVELHELPHDPMNDWYVVRR